jgi:asparagine synthase (glutamine-hydrolysing)
MGFQPYHTHLRSKLELAPATDDGGNLLALDGRLDNYRDICQDLQLDQATADSQIILAAYARWGKNCFSRFIGDWALALWSPNDQVLCLARDHAGSRTLYFEERDGTLVWSTHLDSFFAGPRSLDLDETYIACHLSAQPIRDLTPYKGVKAVLPAHYVAVRNGMLSKAAHWHWMSQANIRYSKDEEYEEHFLALFAQAVERRDGPGAPIVAQLSGGMDSSSIICMSDHTGRLRNGSIDLLDTISFYDDSEPNWNERPYFTAVESQRGKTGTHVRRSFTDRTFRAHDTSRGRYFIPGADSSTIERETLIHSVIGQKGYRVILSGIGGDEILGGIPAPEPELADYLLAGRLKLLLKRTLDWCLIDRSPYFHMLFATAMYACDLYRQPHMNKKTVPPWIPQNLQRACAAIVRTDVTRGRRSGFSPTSIGNGLAWWSIVETLPHLQPGLLGRPEYRYPYLDRQLVDFLFGIPREQLVRPGRRRSLMRRALKNIVPETVLERRRKAYQIRGPLSAIQHARGEIDLLLSHPLMAANGYVVPTKLRAALESICDGREVKWWQALMRTITFELWLQEFNHNPGHGVLVSLN